MLYRFSHVEHTSDGSKFLIAFFDERGNRKFIPRPFFGTAEQAINYGQGYVDGLNLVDKTCNKEKLQIARDHVKQAILPLVDYPTFPSPTDYWRPSVSFWLLRAAEECLNGAHQDLVAKKIYVASAELKGVGK